MVRAFTISFDFDGKTYLALASVKEQEKEIIYDVRLYDDSLYRIVPGGNISSSNMEEYSQSSLKHPLANKLMSCINQSITDHLNACHRI